MTNLFLGLDLSTQALKGVLIDESIRIVQQATVRFDEELPEYHTRGGVHRHADGVTVTAPPRMWVKALDLVLEKMKAERWPLDRVRALSGSAQQHGSVWWRTGAREVLQTFRPDYELSMQLEACFSLTESPVWMDSSTTLQCRALETALGGADETARLTGSRAYERFTASQIAKIRREKPDVYANTERISLVSSFLASLFLADYAPIDLSDGSGMNLLDIRRKVWVPRALEHTAEELGIRLGEPVPAHSCLGSIHSYFSRRYGFACTTKVIAFSGDNPNSLAGLRLALPGEVAVSLGTSDTLFGSLTEPRPSGEEGHVFVSPVDPESYMAMVVRKNGSLTRERVRDSVAEGSWTRFSEMLERVAPGNCGYVIFHIIEPEITPPIQRTGIFRFDRDGRRVERGDPGMEVRGLVESQFLSLRVHAERIGLRPAKILATGGASKNETLVGILADVFGVVVETGAYTDSAAVGAACRALHGWICAQRGRYVPFQEAVPPLPPAALTRRPDPVAHGIYTEMLSRFEVLENLVAGEGCQG
ncbi:MAG: xylulose kinase [Kiritimatiellae bacterium]|nr:xylulose kinase [Kiritimatiellia bacterium]